MENSKISRNLITLILTISIINLLIYLLTTAFTSYGMFRDEYYYLACANRLDFGYVDHPPFSIWVLALWKWLFGDSMFVIRIISAIVTSMIVFMIGLFTIRLGGNKTAVIISSVTFMLSPIFLGMNTIYSMNVFDFLFWISSAYVFLRIVQTGNSKLWIMLGVVIGFGLLNKTSMLWLVAGIFAGTILTPLRRDLKTKYPYIAALIALLIFSPYIIWNITHDFAHLEFMRNAASRKYGGLTPISFILDQILILNPLSILIWLPGIVFYFFNKDGKQFRAVGYIWLTTFIILFLNWHSKGEYISAAYQILFAGGAVMIEKWSTRKNWIKYAVTAPIILFGILLAPFARPLLSVDKFVEYQNAIGLKPPSNEGHETELPQFYSDMFGWEDLAKNISKVYLSIPEAEREKTLVYCSNYGKAGAIEYFSKKYSLPAVICPHNSYWYWWPDDKKYTTVIIIGGEIEEHLESLEEVYEAGYHQTKYAMPYENNQKIFIGRGLKISLDEIRESNKIFI
ncbi:MAG TPA: glycosyltransferase family 39 protein [Ignavibacteriaceae bacterium]|nr:glycosyltransferase family 39 protein [Ignavibacteriaceae bacterium]